MKKLAFLIIALISIQSSAFASKSPALAVKTFDGENFDLKEKHGKVILVNFWASWCLDCRKEMVILNEIYQEYHEKGLEIIGISIDSKKYSKIALNLARNLPYQNSKILRKIASIMLNLCQQIMPLIKVEIFFPQLMEKINC